ncbi:sprT-like domain-containing protein Spartan [Vombatus ursinus]|uniref:DNA-dependent metalloprotease SPRTN n=1 Tax=Vombatus ursinus TaxID=29139 RepID=A0A4X2JX98_VOMUR|nr:sprT-like domain-containing protein Spartan [Vombatus ursinus]XP_027726573.1 sprT-like domain-containing protein Spartan [Vombatus ursinus]
MAAVEEDFALALKLQEEWNTEVPALVPPPKEPKSLVDEAWELVDPNPDLRALFVQFNKLYFWGRLGAVEVKWSFRMTLCAGFCKYEGKGGMCSISLSEPLLKLRPRKDLIETLLHEMIHAYLFVTNNDKDREGHGPEFCKHMRRINRLTGANITIYHNFHDEVDVYRQHWWRCNGPCRNRKPYYGYVKRAMNRAPSAKDFWWAEHQRTCGGTYIKVKEPEGYSTTGKKKTELEKQPNSGTESKDKGKPKEGGSQLLTPFSGKGYLLGGTSSTSSLGKLINPHALNKTQELPNQNCPLVATRPNHKTELKSNSSRGINSSEDELSNKRPKVENKTAFANFFIKKEQMNNICTSENGSKCSSFPVTSSQNSSSLISHKKAVSCPVCQTQVLETEINEHLDSCLM